MSDSGGGIVYHAVSPQLTLGLRICAGATGLLGAISLLMTLIKGGTLSSSFYLLVVNLILTAAITGVIFYWYHTGILAEDRIWFTFAAVGIFAFQCLIVDIWVFNYVVTGPDILTPTVDPHTIRTMSPNPNTTQATISPLML